MLVICFIILATLNPFLSQKCITFSSNEVCLTCKFGFFEKFYLKNLKLSISADQPLTESDCVAKDLLYNKRSVAVYNIKKCEICGKFNEEYLNLAVALQEEAKLASKFYFYIPNFYNF
jgi:hypothetical protein